LQAGARELSYSSTPPQSAKSLIPRIENFLIHCRADGFLFLLPLEASQWRRFVLFESGFREGQCDSVCAIACLYGGCAAGK
jgi:hypothetical protein